MSDSALVRMGADAAILRAEVVDGARVQLLEAEIRASGRNRVQLNRHPLQRTRDLLGLMRVTVFAPDDLQLVKGGPAGRRDYLDDLLVAISPRYEAARADYERVLKQRNALLRGGLRGEDAVGTLDIFDLQLAGAGAELARGRVKMLERLVPEVADAYAELAGARTPITTTYEAEWATTTSELGGLDGDLDAALLDAFTARRRAEIERGVTLVGPHRDEWRLLVGGLESRTHASQGEQRTLALALRLGGHRLCGELTGSTPVLLLDDVFSELDDQRAGRAGRAPRRGSDPGHDGGHGARTASPPTACCASTPAASRKPRERPRMRYGGDEPVPLSDALAAVGAELGMPAGNVHGRLEERWAEVMGDDVAAHAHLVSVRDGTLTVTVDGPIWATQMRYLETAVVERAAAVVGPGVVTALEGPGGPAGAAPGDAAKSPRRDTDPGSGLVH